MDSRFLVLLCLALLLASFAGAVISSQRAVDFVTKDNYYLYENESGQVFPTVKIKNSGQYYWLVAVSSGELPVAYIPVLDKTAIAVPENTAIQRALFKTADVMWFVSKFKERLSSQDQWFFSTTNVSFFSQLSQVLKNEPFELESIKTDLKDSKANAEILVMNSLLVSMSLKDENLSEKINETIAAEQLFFNEPDTGKLDSLRQTFNEAFSLITELRDEKTQYDASVSKLKKIISESSLDASKKNQLLSFANPPQQLLQLSSKADVADSVKQAIDSAFASSISRSKDLVDNLSLRIKRNNAARALKAFDEDFRKKTDNQFDSVEQAAATILSSDYYSLWENREKLSEFSENYSRAKSLFEKGDFDLSLEYAKKAKSAAISVLHDGFIAEEPQGIDWMLLIYSAIALVAVIIVIFILRNRGKFSSLVQQQGNEEEVKLHGWEKRP